MSIPDQAAHTDAAIAKPHDFEQFWHHSCERLNQCRSAFETTPQTQRNDITHHELEYNSWNNNSIKGYFLQWNDAKPRPLLIYTHGYHGHCEIQWDWAEMGFNVFGFDTRGFGRSTMPIHEDGWILTGIESPEKSILRGAIFDYLRAAEIARQLTDGKIERTLFYGFSFGGAMALMAAALTKSADLVVAGVPSFGWMAGRRRLVKQGSGLEVNRHIRRHPEQEVQIMRTLSYFDTANFAPMIKAPCLIGIGKKDIVVPAETVRIICNKLETRFEVREFPYSHSDQPEERLWLDFEREWLELGLGTRKLA